MNFIQKLMKRTRVNTPTSYTTGVPQKTDLIVDGIYNPVEWIYNECSKYDPIRWKINQLADKNKAVKSLTKKKDLFYTNKVYFELLDSAENVSIMMQYMVNNGIRGMIMESNGGYSGFVYSTDLDAFIKYKASVTFDDTVGILDSIAKHKAQIYSTIFENTIFNNWQDIYFDYLSSVNNNTEILLAGVSPITQSKGDDYFDTRNIIFTVFTKNPLAISYATKVYECGMGINESPYYLMDFRFQDLLGLRDELIATSIPTEPNQLINDTDNILKFMGGL